MTNKVVQSNIEKLSSEIVYQDLSTEHIETHADSTDIVLLKKIAHEVLKKDDILTLEQNINFLINNLETRAIYFAKNRFSMKRFQGWVSVLCNLAGLFNVGNMRFLYETGKLLDDRIYEKLMILHEYGLNFSNAKFGDIKNVDDWLKIIGRKNYPSRSLLANGLNYLARDYYIFSRQKGFEQFNFLNKHFDMLVQIFTFSDLRNNNKESTLFKDVLKAHTKMEIFFQSKCKIEDNENIIWLKKIISLKIKVINAYVWEKKFPNNIKKLFLLFNKLSQNLNKHDVMLQFKHWYLDLQHNYTNDEISHFLPLIQNINAKRTLLVIDVLTHDKIIVNKSILLKLNGLFELGEHIENLHSFDFSDFLIDMNYSEMFYLFGLYKYVPSLFTNEFLINIKNRLLKLHAGKSHNINHVARMTQFNKICELQENINNANNVYNHIFDIMKRKKYIKKNKYNRRNKVLFILSGCPVTAPLFSAVTIPLLAEGVSFYNLEDNGFENKIVTPWPYSPRLFSDSSNCINSHIKDNKPLNEGWCIDLAKGKLELDGINYYQGMYERMSRLFKVFDLNWSMPSIQLFYNLWFLKVDRILFTLKEVKKVALKKNYKIKLVSLQSQFNPWYAMKIFCENNSDIFNHITIGSSYENWKNNMSSEVLTTFAMLNNTVNPIPSVPAFGTKKGFEKWYSKFYLQNKDKLSSLNNKLVSIKRSGEISPTVIGNLTEKINNYKKEGKIIFCVLGKIPYDMAVPYQGGPAHSDMSDWLNHTVNTIENSNNILLVKPHPHELNYSISAKPVQGFLDMINNKHLKNTILLPHRGINIQNLFEYVDVFLCWNGSSIAELGSQNKKIIACDDWATKNYPIDVYLPTSRIDYKNILLGKKDVIMHPNFLEKSIAYTVYLTEAPFSINYPFVHRSSTNTKFHEVSILTEQFTEDNVKYMMRNKNYAKDIFKLT